MDAGTGDEADATACRERRRVRRRRRRPAQSLRQRDGRRNWAYAYEMPIAGRLAADEHHVYATTIDNSVHGHAFNGHRTWHKLLAFRVVDGMFSDSGSVFVPQSNGEIRIFLAKDGTRAGRLNSSPAEATVIGGLVAGGSGDQLRMAITTRALADRLTTYKRTGLPPSPLRARRVERPCFCRCPVGVPDSFAQAPRALLNPFGRRRRKRQADELPFLPGHEERAPGDIDHASGDCERQ